MRSARRLPMPLWLVATVLCHLPAFVHPMMDDDEGVYAAVAVLMNTGGRLYAAGGVDNKFPGIYGLYALVFKVFGAYSMVAIHVVALMFVLGTAALLGFIAHRLSDDERAFGWAALFYGVFSASYYPKMLAANTELFMMLPLAGSMAMALPRTRASDGGGRSVHDDVSFACSGALLVVACLFKQVALLNAPALAAQIYWRRRTGFRLRALAASVFGAAVAAAVALAVLFRTVSLPGLWQWAIRGLGRYGRGGWSGSTVGHGLLAFAAFVGSCFALCLMAGLSYRGRRGHRRRGERLLTWCVSSIIAVAISGRFFGHYFLQLIAPLSIVAALQVLHLVEGNPRWAGHMLTLTAFPAVAFGTWALLADPITGRLGAPVPDYVALGRYVESLTSPTDRIFVWGNFAPIYVTSKRAPATRFVGFLRGLDRGHAAASGMSWDVGENVWTDLRADWVAHPPRIVIDTSTGDYSDFGTYPLSLFPAVQKLIDGGFVRIGVVEGATLYARNVDTTARLTTAVPPPGF